MDKFYILRQVRVLRDLGRHLDECGDMGIFTEEELDMLKSLFVVVSQRVKNNV